jgi:hypothetical protein
MNWSLEASNQASFFSMILWWSVGHSPGIFFNLNLFTERLFPLSYYFTFNVSNQTYD